MNHRRGNGEAGSASVEVALLTPLVVVMLSFIVLCGRYANATEQVTDAARQAARTATLAPTPATAAARARGVVATDLRSDHLHCTTTTDTTTQPGTVATVTCHCTLTLTNLTPLHIPAHLHLTATAHAPIDTYRPAARADQ